MSIPRDSYAELHGRFAEALDWMHEVGVQIPPGRTQEYLGALADWTSRHEKATDREAKEAFVPFVSAINEVQDFLRVFDAFRAEDPDELSSIVEKLQEAVNGPSYLFEESPRTSRPRNFLFEAAVAAKVHQPERGIKAMLNTPTDAGFWFEKHRFLIECKRASSLERIGDNIRRGTRQLQRALTGRLGSGYRGLVAIDISKVFTSGNEIFARANERELRGSLNLLMDNFINENCRTWEEIYQRRSRKILGAIFRYSFVASSEADGLLITTDQWALNPALRCKDSETNTLRRITGLLGG